MSAAEDEPQVWDRQPGETGLSYAAFCRYRDMGPFERSLSKLAKELAPAKTKPKLNQLKEWSRQHNWVARAEAWDAEQERLSRKLHEKKLKEMVEKHLNIALTIQGKAASKLKQLNPDIDPDALSPMDALRYMESAIKLERMTLGEPDQIIKHEGEIKTEVSHELSNRILDDPEAARLACELFERLAMGESNASRVSDKSKPGSLEAGAASGAAES